MLLEKPPDVCAVHLFAIHTWTPKMVEFWLCRLNVDGSIIKRFQEERIKGRHLHRLTENHLERLGCDNMGDRFDILNAISSIPPVGNVCVGTGKRKQPGPMPGPPFQPPWSKAAPYVNNSGFPRTLELNVATDLLDYVLEHFTSFEFDHTTIFNILDFLYGHYDPPGKSRIGRSKLLEAIRVGKQLNAAPGRNPRRNLLRRTQMGLLDQLRMRLSRRPQHPRLLKYIRIGKKLNDTSLRPRPPPLPFWGRHAMRGPPPRYSPGRVPPARMRRSHPVPPRMPPPGPPPPPSVPGLRWDSDSDDDSLFGP